ncbi:Cys-Gln thioester bond-forming surface protein [Streptomyces sp. SP17BM10]|uniref:Cys-Gln thioester bond-forming surface protein n=1 Tax=Streptomyces sp. SP17BM10 TaxID=3002530 RepID=UPI002E77AA6D|nr:Cys-Gln thioester bond-forming surface protein [Streptomyces sp. SP17BM10]MEE1785385.1 Cys-Gln thioester bond-forming surface protein [Streptomyces sp. SP17BM10]
MLTTSIALGGGLFAAGAAAAAAPGAGVTAIVQDTMLGEKIDIEGGETVNGGLFTLKTDSGELQTYCIDFGNPVYLDSGAQYQESDWKSSSLGRKDKAQDASKIRWILENSYPQVTDLAKLSKDAGVTGQLSPEDAAAGTQAAIWKFSDGKNATPRDGKAKQLRDYLIGDKNKGIAAEPKPSLTLAPESVSGKSGGKLGPFTLNSSAAQVKLAVAGSAADKIKVLDKDGKQVNGVLNGPIAKDTQLFLDVPAGTPDGGATLTASAETVVPSGRVFLSEGYTPEKHSQTMILAGSSKLSVSATAKATWKQGKGALLDSIAQVECDSNGVRVTVANGGDEAGTVNVKPVGKDLVVQPGKTESLVVPVDNKAAYDITVTGPNGYTHNFKGILDCKGTGTPVTPSSGPSTPAATGKPSTPAGTPSASVSTAAHPAPAVTSSAPGTGGLAQTGASSNTPILAGVAGALVIAGGAAVFFLRRRGRHGGSAA